MHSHIYVYTHTNAGEQFLRDMITYKKNTPLLMPLKKTEKNSNISSKKYEKYLLSGKKSKLLHHELLRLDATSPAISNTSSSYTNYTISDRIFLAQKYYKIFNFYGGSNGSNDLWSGVLNLLALSHSHERKSNIDNGEEKVSGRGKNSLLTEADVKAILAATEGTKERYHCLHVYTSAHFYACTWIYIICIADQSGCESHSSCD
jgi:hypothetical protein